MMMHKFDENSIKESIFGFVKFSESVALQIIESTTTVLKACLDSADSIGDRASGMIASLARKAIDSGNSIENELSDITKNAVKSKIQSAAEIRDFLIKTLKSKEQND